MYDFTYHRAASLDQAKAAFESAEDARYMAGGMTLLPTLKQRLAQPSDVIDLAGVPDMAGVRRDGDAVVIKALTTHAAVAASAATRQPTMTGRSLITSGRSADSASASEG